MRALHHKSPFMNKPRTLHHKSPSMNKPRALHDKSPSILYLYEAFINLTFTEVKQQLQIFIEERVIPVTYKFFC